MLASPEVRRPRTAVYCLGRQSRILFINGRRCFPLLLVFCASGHAGSGLYERLVDDEPHHLSRISYRKLTSLPDIVDKCIILDLLR